MPDQPSMTSRRTGSTIHVTGLASATTRNQPFISAVGKKAELTKTLVKISGKVALTASWLPVRMARTCPSPPMARTSSTADPSTTAMAAGPPATSAPKARKTATISAPLAAATTSEPASRPSRSGRRAHGEERSRSKKPFSMSRANSVPASVAPNDTACTRLAGSTKSRKESTAGKPGMRMTRWNWWV